MFKVVDKLNLRTSSIRHKLMIEVDQLIENEKVFTLSECNETSKKRRVTCDIYDGDKIVNSYSSVGYSYGEAIRKMGRHIKRTRKECEDGLTI